MKTSPQRGRAPVSTITTELSSTNIYPVGIHEVAVVNTEEVEKHEHADHCHGYWQPPYELFLRIYRSIALALFDGVTRACAAACGDQVSCRVNEFQRLDIDTATYILTILALYVLAE
ncbi:hypothetical protein EKPV-NSW-ORF136 [Eastern grey kangaroopox virus]|uniref:Uncharacterized protein n=1 Tax=Eastern grey kangaroopox virus TaxID=2042482 RepID=A0A2H4QTP1_9POXV|nr:hypothetical protein EKPV-NSW-ORF136 [Eastern grey kangaroopox virus]